MQKPNKRALPTFLSKEKDLDTATVPNLGRGPKRLKAPQLPQYAVRAGIVHGVRIGQRVLWRVNRDFFDVLWYRRGFSAVPGAILVCRLRRR